MISLLLALAAAPAAVDAPTTLPLSPADNTVASAPQGAPSDTTSADDPANHPLTLSLDLGIAMPVGAAGVTLEYSPIRALGFGCGVGTNLVGVEVACGVRGRLVTKKSYSFTLSSGLSEGRHVQNESTRLGLFGLVLGPLMQSGHTTYLERTWQHAYWWYGDIGIENRGSDRLFSRVFVGASLLANPGQGVLAAPRDSHDTATPLASVLVYGGVSFVWSL
jgi:hypothetical protein